MLGAIDWIVSELDILGVDMQLGVEVDAAYLQAEAPDAIVLATGVEGVEFDASSDGTVDVLTIDEAMDGDFAGRRIVILDQVAYQESAFCAEHLARRGANVTLVTPFPSVGINIGFTHIRGHLERLHAEGVEMHTSTVVTGVSEGAVATRHVYARTNDAIPADALVIAGVRNAALDLYDAARDVCDQVILAGDVVANRQALHAFREGDRAGRLV
jgi:2,4-dienoyl-CoA reductase (NADPH2)